MLVGGKPVGHLMRTALSCKLMLAAKQSQDCVCCNMCRMSCYQQQLQTHAGAAVAGDCMQLLKQQCTSGLHVASACFTYVEYDLAMCFRNNNDSSNLHFTLSCS